MSEMNDSDLFGNSYTGVPTRCCRKCLKNKPIDEFRLHKAKRPDLKSHRDHVCRRCVYDECKQWHKENPERAKERCRQTNLRRKFKMTPGRYAAMLEEQDGVCFICKKPETQKRKGVVKALAVDHNHKTGVIRRLLCCSCNALLGYAMESVEILKACIDYLEMHEEKTNQHGSHT